MEKFESVMLDLEYLARSPHALILSIGLAAFDARSGVGPTFHTVLSRDEQEAGGRVVDAQTQAWWAEQSEDARAAIWNAEPVSVDRGLAEMERFIMDFTVGTSGVLVWGNGAANDVAKLENLYAWCGRRWPFGIRADRCYRTLKALSPEWLASAEAKTRRTTHHRADDDALYQAGIAVRILRKHAAALRAMDAVAVLAGPEDTFECSLAEGPEREELAAAFCEYDQS